MKSSKIRSKIRSQFITKHIALFLPVLVGGLLVASSAEARAKNYALFRLDTGLTGSMAHDSGGYGVGGFVEPKFNVLDTLAVGVRMEGHGMFGGDIDTGVNQNVDLDMRATAAFLAKADYYIGTGTVRPFVGLGLGLYYFAGQSLSATNINQNAGSYFGIAPQVGVQLGAFRLAFTYNAILGANYEVSQSAGPGGINQSVSGDQSISRNYMTLDIGFRFGGGKRRAPRRPATVAH
jgi:hypothetical protein